MAEVQSDFMSRPGVIGVGAGASDTDPSSGAIHVYVDRTSGQHPVLPAQVEGVKVLQIFTDPFVAY
ncbi:MAG TPA: hypothetical protein VLV78_24130 [Thermoanaerobaculia bacterium]|nr:hypothetical protein [Thermoanaerobaculia bacterium]